MTNAHHRHQSFFPICLLKLGFRARNFSDSRVGTGRVPNPFHGVHHEHFLRRRSIRYFDRIGVGIRSVSADG